MTRPLLISGVTYIPAVTSSGSPIYVALSYSLWNAASGGTRYTDLLVDGLAADSFTTAPDGQAPQVEGKDGTTDAWLDILTPGYTLPHGRIHLYPQGGATGATGAGVPAGGTTGQVLVKTSGADNATAWADPATGTVPDATTAVKGKVQLATNTQATAGTDTATAVTPAGVAAALSGLTVVAGVYVWRYTAGAWPTLPTTRPAGVQKVDAIGPTQPSSVPTWIGLDPGLVPATYEYAPLT